MAGIRCRDRLEDRRVGTCVVVAGQGSHVGNSSNHRAVRPLSTVSS